MFLKPPSKLTTIVLRVLSTLKLTEITAHPTSGTILEANNLTILNFFLLRLGPMNEKRLVQVLISSQVCHSAIASFRCRGLLIFLAHQRLPEVFWPSLYDMGWQV